VGDLPSCQSFGPVCLGFIDYKSGSLHRALEEEGVFSDVIPERLFSSTYETMLGLLLFFVFVFKWRFHSL